jgi:RHS repeat-associated protein
VQDQTGRSVSFAYTGNDLTQLTDANGKVETYTYTTAGSMVGLLTARALPLGNKPFTQVWDGTGKVIKQSDSRGNATTYVYDPAGVAPTVITDPLGAAQQQVHTGYKNETSITDANGNTISIAYDANGHRTSVTDRLGDKTTATYHSPSGYPASVTDALGDTTAYTYTAQTQGSFTFYVPSKIQYADGTSVSIVYDGSGNATSVTDQAGKVTKFTYNGRGQVLTVTNAAGGVTTFTYNPDATVATITDASGNVTTFTYDDKKRPIHATYADGTATANVYDNRDNILNVTNERGKVIAAAYNDNNDLKNVTDPLGNAAGLQYDGDERVTTRTDFAGKSTNRTYNENGLLKMQTNPAGDSFSVSYDKLHRPVSVLDASGKGSSFTYDKEDVLASVTDALSRTSAFTTDKLGRTTQTTTPLGENYKTTYDKVGGITSQTDPLGNTAQYVYDARELLTSVSLPLGISAMYGRTDLGLIGSITDPNGNVWTRSLDSAGRLTVSTDPLGRMSSATYDSRSRLSGAQSPETSASLTYDAAGNLIRQLYSAGSVAGPDLNFIFDDNNRLLSGPGFNFTYDANGALTSSNGIAVARDDDGRISSISYSAGKSVKYIYDSRGLLVSVTDWLGGVTTLAYDDAHELVSITRPNGTNTKFTYDRDGRLSGIVESTGSSIALVRDAAGKETSATRNLPQTAVPPTGVLPLTYDAAQQISGAQYDGVGRLLNDGTRTYTWDAASRLVAYSGANGASTSTYDGLGVRISKSSSGDTQNYLLNYALGLPSISTVQDGSNKDQRYYVHLPNGTILYSVEAADSSRRFFHFDEVGSTTFLTNDSGAVTDSYGVTPYGESVTPGASNSTANPFTWLGAYGVMQEGATSLYYMRARWYDSSPARFLSPDPVSSLAPQKINPYQYVQANPIAAVDPFGLDDLPPFYGVPILLPNPRGGPPLTALAGPQFVISTLADGSQQVTTYNQPQGVVSGGGFGPIGNPFFIPESAPTVYQLLTSAAQYPNIPTGVAFPGSSILQNGPEDNYSSNDERLLEDADRLLASTLGGYVGGYRRTQIDDYPIGNIHLASAVTIVPSAAEVNRWCVSFACQAIAQNVVDQFANQLLGYRRSAPAKLTAIQAPVGPIEPRASKLDAEDTKRILNIFFGTPYHQ